jgi:hypothetical protein
MIKARLMALVLAVVCLPAIAFGSSIDFGNAKGKLRSVGGTAISLSGSKLISISGLSGFDLTGKNIGNVDFTTGSLLSGSLAGTATFGAGGTFDVTSSNGVVFSGTFTDGTWTAITGAGPNNWGWTFTGNLTGTVTTSSGSQVVSGVTVQVSTINKNASRNPFRDGGPGKIGLSGGMTTTGPSAVPEVGTLGLLGIGLVGAALFARVSKRNKLAASV